MTDLLLTTALRTDAIVSDSSLRIDCWRRLLSQKTEPDERRELASLLVAYSGPGAALVEKLDDGLRVALAEWKRLAGSLLPPPSTEAEVNEARYARDLSGCGLAPAPREIPIDLAAAESEIARRADIAAAYLGTGQDLCLIERKPPEIMGPNNAYWRRPSDAAIWLRALERLATSGRACRLYYETPNLRFVDRRHAPILDVAARRKARKCAERDMGRAYREAAHAAAGEAERAVRDGHPAWSPEKIEARTMVIAGAMGFRADLDAVIAARSPNWIDSPPDLETIKAELLAAVGDTLADGAELTAAGWPFAVIESELRPIVMDGRRYWGKGATVESVKAEIQRPSREARP